MFGLQGAVLFVPQEIGCDIYRVQRVAAGILARLFN